jgi:hypothetical protein
MGVGKGFDGFIVNATATALGVGGASALGAAMSPHEKKARALTESIPDWIEGVLGNEHETQRPR